MTFLWRWEYGEICCGYVGLPECNACLGFLSPFVFFPKFWGDFAKDQPKVLDNFVGCLNYWASSDILSDGDGRLGLSRIDSKVIPTGPSWITPTVQPTLKQGNLPLTFQDTHSRNFHPKLPLEIGGVFFSTVFFFKTQLQHPKDDENPDENFWRFWRMAALLGIGDWRLGRRSKRKKSGWRGCRWEKNMSSSLAIDEKLQWKKYVKAPRIARMWHWKISCSWIFEPNYFFPSEGTLEDDFLFPKVRYEVHK